MGSKDWQGHGDLGSLLPTGKHIKQSGHFGSSWWALELQSWSGGYMEWNHMEPLKVIER